MVKKFPIYIVMLAFMFSSVTANTLAGTTGDGVWAVNAQFTDENGRVTAVRKLASNVLYRAEVVLSPLSGSECPSHLLFDAGMPAHYHGMSTKAKVSGNGCKFFVSGVYFQMRGAWEIYFDVALGSTSSRATFIIELEK